ncbi:hypothetical protein D3H55_23565 [Bacillus salacetis]|uniref:Uncharacterized protein n=1 Tax=Bacillus salacetis TaxID=2315464 RepID=A0A3A1QMJ5_9BACI|nr:hypothetical protein [Bacillus salacetis]RIW26567.1 hypothetical protein D3H55_23565 [Bacillus salacetis]
MLFLTEGKGGRRNIPFKKYKCLMLLLTFLIAGCNNSNELPIEMAAYNSLTEEEAQLIPVSPKDAVVEKVLADEELGEKIGKEFIGQSIYTVTFNHTENEQNGRLIVYLEKDKKTIIGKGFEQ